MKSGRWLFSYIFVASVGLWMAFFISMRFMSKAHSQTPPPPPAETQQAPPNPAGTPKMDAPSSGDLPPEFSQDLEQALKDKAKAEAPQPPPAVPPDGSAAAGAGQPSQQQMPPPQPPPVPPSSAGGAPPPSMPPLQPTPVQGTMTSPEEGSGPPPVIPQFADDDQYTYDPTGRRDPFKPYRAFRASPQVNGQGRVIDLSDPLQRFDVGRYTVVAIMWEVRHPRAMVQDPDGKVYMVMKNTKIGRNFGQVVAIREGEVVVVEDVDNEGVVTKEVKILELKN